MLHTYKRVGGKVRRDYGGGWVTAGKYTGSQELFTS